MKRLMGFVIVLGDGEGGRSGDEEEATREAGSVGVTPWSWYGSLYFVKGAEGGQMEGTSRTGSGEEVI